MALYLLKRANYDIQTWPTTLDLLRTDKDGYKMQETERLESSHPMTFSRIREVKKHIDEVNLAFNEKYQVAGHNYVQEFADSIMNWIRILFT